MKYIIAVLFFFMGGDLNASHPLSTDDSSVVEKDKYEIEIGYNSLKIEDEEEFKDNYYDFSIKYGLSQRVDFGINFSYHINSNGDKNEFKEMNYTAKFRLINDFFALAFTSTSGSREYFINGVFSHNINNLSFHVNTGIYVDENGGKEGVYSFAFEYPVLKLDLVGEIVKSDEGNFYLSGIRYKLYENVFLDCGFGSGFNKDFKKITLGFHMEY